jgi:hypothetical protein
MKRILAVLNDFGCYLFKDEQMDEFLEKGFTLYTEENGKQEMLANPEEGFLIERPNLTETKTFNLKG